MTALYFKDRLVTEISRCDSVKGIGQTGDIQAQLIKGQSDIDLFILCTTVPLREDRVQIYKALAGGYSDLMMEVCNGGIWGCGDVLISDGIEIMPMYFTKEEMEEYLDDTLKGKNLAKDGGFYPTGRLASVETINILYEEEMAWTRLIRKVKEYPQALFQKLFSYHISLILDDESLGRVLLRKEILFYHQVLEVAIDHLLQAIFALNHRYFPSRKRTQSLVELMHKKPFDFYNRLIRMIADASEVETIENSVQELRKITAEIAGLANDA